MELIGTYTNAGEECYVVALKDYPSNPVLIFSKRIYRYEGEYLKNEEDTV